MATEGETTSLLGSKAAVNFRKYADTKAAYDSGDIEASRLAHSVKSSTVTEEDHNTDGSNVKAIVFGGLDGVLTSFAIVAGAAGGHLSVETVLILGFSNIFADALSMGVGEHLSTKAHNEYVMSEKAKETWELRHFPEGEIEEMIDLYEERGMGREDATEVVKRMAKYKEFFVNVMMVEELGLQVPDEDEDTIKDGIVMFCSFALFGSMPLIGYVIAPLVFPDMTSKQLFATACLVTAITLFTLGSVKAKIASSDWWKGGLEMLILGGLCAFVAFIIGDFMQGIVSKQ